MKKRTLKLDRAHLRVELLRRGLSDLKVVDSKGVFITLEDSELRAARRALYGVYKTRPKISADNAEMKARLRAADEVLRCCLAEHRPRPKGQAPIDLEGGEIPDLQSALWGKSVAATVLA